MYKVECVIGKEVVLWMRTDDFERAVEEMEWLARNLGRSTVFTEDGRWLRSCELPQSMTNGKVL